MVDVMPMLSAIIGPRPLRSNASAEPDTPTRVPTRMSLALVKQRQMCNSARLSSSMRTCLDSCLVKNGECDANALCSHHSTSNAVKCTCKTGYSNTGSDSNVICTGEMVAKDETRRRFAHPSFGTDLFRTDSCKVKNGECDPNALC